MSAAEVQSPVNAALDESKEAEGSSSQREPRRVYGNNASATFLEDLSGKLVIVKQPSGIEYRGTLYAVDGFLNVVLRDTQEIYAGKVLSELGEVFLRGSSVDYVAAA